MNRCPRCEDRGRSAGAVTLEAQVLPNRRKQLRDLEGWKLCLSKTCEVVYFRGMEVIVLGQTLAVPFHKSDDPSRLVCFCFEHSVAEVEADSEACGKPKIQAAIEDACKAGRHDCERKNPQGRCCLGNVREVVRATPPVGEADERDGGCCEKSASA